MAYQSKPATADTPIHRLIADRWSPYSISEKPLSVSEIASLFEAARWAPSSFNEQPWRYVYAETGNPNRAKLDALLVEGNAWAKGAGLLIVSFSRKTFTYNGKENRHALHDLGAASYSLCLQAASMGLVTHQMAGFAADKANAALGVPQDYVPGSMIAVGYPGDLKTLAPELKKRDDAPRSRNAVKTFAFDGTWKL